ncbi:MAG: type II toxin-antitoxin system HicA family toxin [Burkholderiaceae bacterium]
MSKFSGLSGQDLVHALRRLGFVEVRISGSHLLMRNKSRTCVVPLHRELKRGTLFGVLRQAGVNIAEFEHALRH